MADKLQPLQSNIQIVDEHGQPTQYFIRYMQQQLGIGFVPSSRQINTGHGLTGGGDLSADRMISLDATLGDLNDVDETTNPPTDGQVLTWVQVDGKWEPADATGGGGSTGEAAWKVDAVGTGAPQNVIIPDIDPTKQRVMVFVNGLRWQTTEYAIAGNVVTLTTNSAGDSIEIVGPLGKADGTAFVIDAVGTGVLQNVNIPFSLPTTQAVMVFVNGLRWQTTEYVIAGNVVTLTTNSAGDSIEIVGPLGFVTVDNRGQTSEAAWNLPDLSGLTWLNQGPATVLYDGHGTVIKALVGGFNFRILYEPRPIGDFDIYARIDELSGFDSDFAGGICLLDSITGKFIHWSNNTTNPVSCYLQTMNSPTSFNGNQIGPKTFMQVPKWLRMNITGTVATCYASTNGIDWVPYGSYNFGGFFTPDSIGVNVNANSVDRDTRFLHFGTVLPAWS